MEDRDVAYLQTTFRQLDDPRSGSGQRHPLAAILTHTTVAVLAGCRSYQAIAQFGRDRGKAFGHAVGYTRDDLPCKATFSNVFRALPAGAFERALRAWLADREGRGWEKASLDGKTLCGVTGDHVPGVHLLALFEHEAHAAIAQISVGAKTNEHKAALALIDVVDLDGKLVTGDAAFCQRDLSEKVTQKKGITAGRSRTISPNSSRQSTGD